MKVIYGTGNLRRGAKVYSKVVAVGVFDGVHRGHQMVLRRAVSEAKRLGLSSAVVTFSFHPSHLFDPLKKTPHLNSLEHKLSFLAKEGIDFCYVIDFDRAFAQMLPQRFVRDVLIEKIGMVSLYVGEDFVFGKGRQGNKALLEKLSRKFGFSLRVLKHFKLNNRIASSTLIRTLVSSGRLKEAARFLGRPFSLMGEVIKGEGRGASLGYPTANIKPHHEVLPPDGIYAASCFLGARTMAGIAYIGSKPTFKKHGAKRSVEIFLFGFKKNIYGRMIEIRFLKKLRRDKKFPSQPALIAQMSRDVNCAKKFFRTARYKPSTTR